MISQKALVITKETDDGRGEVRSYGDLFISLREYDKAKEYIEKALVIRMKIDDKQGEAAIYSNLGALSKCLGGYDKVKNAFHRKKEF